MIAGYKFGSCLSTFANCSDRYCKEGYGEGAGSLKEMLEAASKVEGLDGLELVGNWHVNNHNIRQVASMFCDYGFEISMLVPDLWTQAKWGRGSLAAPDKRTRQAAIDEVKKVMDWSAELSCQYIDIWPGQDGFDYPFQSNYIDTWKWLVESLKECSEHNDKVRALVEYKPKEPRTHCYVSTVGKVLLLLKDLEKVGVLLDWGHALQGGENIAESTALLSEYGKLDYLHLNDNYRSWDDDLMVGSVHIIELLEWFFWLKKVNYNGWLTLDIFPYRENGIEAAIQSREWIKGIFESIEKVGLKEFETVIDNADACEASRLVRKTFNL
jgi:xylose isomerase